MRLSESQKKVYLSLFEKSKHRGKIKSLNALKVISAEAKTIFGYDLFQTLKNSGELSDSGDSCQRYLMLIILEAKKLTFLASDDNTVFNEFYENTAQLCLNIVMHFALQSSDSRKDVYTVEFQQFIKKTIRLSLSMSGYSIDEERSRILDIVRYEYRLEYARRHLESVCPAKSRTISDAVYELSKRLLSEKILSEKIKNFLERNNNVNVGGQKISELLQKTSITEVKEVNNYRLKQDPYYFMAIIVCHMLYIIPLYTLARAILTVYSDKSDDTMPYWFMGSFVALLVQQVLKQVMLPYVTHRHWTLINQMYEANEILSKQELSALTKMQLCQHETESRPRAEPSTFVSFVPRVMPSQPQNYFLSETPQRIPHIKNKKATSDGAVKKEEKVQHERKLENNLTYYHSLSNGRIVYFNPNNVDILDGESEQVKQFSNKRFYVHKYVARQHEPQGEYKLKVPGTKERCYAVDEICKIGNEEKKVIVVKSFSNKGGRH